MTNTTHFLTVALIHDTECLLAILRTINDVDDPERQSFLVDAAENIGSNLLSKLQCNEAIEDAASSDDSEAGEAI
ncbi:hypothetical protein [Serratia liquefaciens]|uniref:Uncharacterized protein n=1 Tax=Serratia liquefaciens TaxID=614 RepID=A0A515CQH4_SERLI|nr:hypothetical protein [Serratia liquefaciens]QDL30419.1 hypothetical protein EGO53_00790 [Serratia liquefaciens]